MAEGTRCNRVQCSAVQTAKNLSFLDWISNVPEILQMLEYRWARCVTICLLLSAGIVGIVRQPHAAWGYALLSISIAWGLVELWFYYKHEHD